MKQTTVIANALDGLSKTFYVKTEDGSDALALDIRVQWGAVLPDAILDLVQFRLQDMCTEVMDAFQRTAGEDSE